MELIFLLHALILSHCINPLNEILALLLLLLLLLHELNNYTLSVDKINQLDVAFEFFISLLLVAQHVSGNHVPIIRS